MPVFLMEYHKSKICSGLMYTQHMKIVCGEFHICHDLVLDQNANDNAYSTPCLHKALDMNHKMVMMGIGCYHNTFSHLYMQHQHYPEQDTLFCPFYLIVYLSVSSLINDSMSTIIFRQIGLDFFGQTDITFGVQERIRIYESNVLDTGS